MKTKSTSLTPRAWNRNKYVPKVQSKVKVVHDPSVQGTRVGSFKRSTN